MYQAGNFSKNSILEKIELTSVKIIDKKKCYKIKHFSNKQQSSTPASQYCTAGKYIGFCSAFLSAQDQQYCPATQPELQAHWKL